MDKNTVGFTVSEQTSDPRVSKILIRSHLQEGRHSRAYSYNNAIIAKDQGPDIHQQSVQNDLWIGLDGVENGNGGRFGAFHGSDVKGNIFDGSPATSFFFKLAGHICRAGSEVGVVEDRR